jgi:VWFA-related protein
MTYRRAVPAALAATLAAVALAASGQNLLQQTQPQPIPRFRTGVEGVVVDVSVLDRDRRPVRGLRASDFAVLEDSVPQTITAFTAIDIPEVVEARAAWLRDVAPDVRRNDDIADRRVVVLVLDDATPMPAEEVPRARLLARTAVEHLGPDDLVAVVHVFNRRASQGFTTDRASLLRSIEKFNGSNDKMLQMGGQLNSQASAAPFYAFAAPALTLYQLVADTLREIAGYLSDLPQRRKALVFVSVGIPVDIEVAQAAVPGEAGMDASGAAAKVITSVRDAITAAQRSNVSIYGLDPGGLRPGMSDRESGGLNRDFLEGVSTSTGGFAITNVNDPVPGIEQVVRENSSYYLLGYQPTSTSVPGAFRKIEVRVNRPGVTVRSRNGYYESSPEKKERTQAAGPSEASLLHAVGALAPQGEVAMQMTAAPFAIPGDDRSAVAIMVRLAQALPADAERQVDTVQLRVNAYDTAGTRRGSENLEAHVLLRPTPTGEAAYEILSRLDLKPGRYELRLAAQSALRQKTGSVFYDIDVPDFSRGSLALSGLVMSVVPGIAVAPRDRLASLLPVIPTSQREFGADDSVSAFVRVYQPGSRPLAPVEMGITLVDPAGAKVLDRHETLGADRFEGSRSADFRFGVPVSNLSPGPHLLTVQASQGRASVRRHVLMTIR